MSLVASLSAAFSAVGADVSSLQDLLNGGAADLSALTTTQKSDLVSALNEVKASVGDVINDATQTGGTTWSSNKIRSVVNSAISDIVGGAPAALDTLNELAAAFNDNPSVIDGILNAQGNRVAVDQVQAFTAAEQLQGCNNLNIGDPSVDFATVYATARDA